VKEVFATGFYKSGNHALVKALQLLGCPCKVDHQPFSESWALWPGARVFIARDPRNVLVSWVRHQGQPVTTGMLIAYARDFEAGQTIAQAMQPYEGWLADAGTLLVRYEALVASDAEMRRIASHVGVDYIDDSWRWLPGMTRTWNKERSDYRAVWTPQVDRAWQQVGGQELLQRWGY
jgi:hypothetical protein